MVKKKQPRRQWHQKYYQIINPINHLERKIERIDKENDRLQYRVLLLSILSVALAVLGILMAVISLTTNH